MEKLILRSIMYGADKIPDSWFEKVPGGFYKAKEAEQKAAAKAGSNSSRPSTSGSGSGSGGRSRRRSTGETVRGSPPDDAYDEGYRSDGRRRRRDRDRDEEPQRSSYDGIDDDYYSGDDRRRRRNHGSARRQRSVEDNERGYEYGTGTYPPRDDRYQDPRASGRPPYPQGEFGPAARVPPPNQYAPSMGATAAGAATGMAGAGAAPYPPSDISPKTMSPNPSARGPMSPNPVSPNPMSPNPMSPPQSRPTTSSKPGMSNGYVPYADIYGSPPPANTRGTFSPPPQSNIGSVQPNDMNRVAPPATPQAYHQNPWAQDGGAPAAAGAAYAQQYQQDSGYDPGYYDPRYEHRYDDRYNGYDESGRPIPMSQSPPPHRGRPDDLQSYTSYDSRDPPRRARSERRPAEDNPKRAKSQGGRGKSRLRETFDTSQRGLGYGAVGALAGGLIGSEVGHGPVATAIGVAVGALGANAFEARERYVPNNGYAPTVSHQPRPPSVIQQPPTVDPRQPLSSQLRGHYQQDHGAGGVPQDRPRRKEGQRHTQWTEDGTYARRDAKRSSGYHSD